MEFMSTDFEFLPLKATIISPSPSPISFFGYKNGIKDARLHTVAKSQFFFKKIKFSIIPFLAGKFKFNIGVDFYQN